MERKKLEKLDLIHNEMPEIISANDEGKIMIEIRKGLVVLAHRGANIRKIRKKYEGK